MKKLTLFLMLFPVLLFGQELSATVTVNYEQLPTASRERLTDFSQQVEAYLNSTKFSEADWSWEKIKCNFTIFFISASDETNYTAQVVITSQRPVENSIKNLLMVKIQDPKWKFKFEPNQSMYFFPNEFEPLTSFLDFYAFLIIGFDSDSYGPEPLGGSEFFSKAYDTAILGASSQFSDGWELSGSAYNKRALVNDLTNEKFQQFRIDYMNYHFYGIDLYAKNKKAAQKNIYKLIEHLAEKRDQIDPRSVLLKIFFDAKSGEILEYMRDYPDKTVFELLKRLDPPRITKYNEVLDEG